MSLAETSADRYMPPSKEVPYDAAQSEIAKIRTGLSLDPSYALQVEDSRHERGMMLPTRTVQIDGVIYEEDVDRQKAPFLMGYQERVDETVMITRISNEGRRSARLRVGSLKNPSNHLHKFGEANLSINEGASFSGQEALEQLSTAFPELFPVSLVTSE